MAKILKQLITTDKFVTNDYLSTTPTLVMNNKNYQDLVYTTTDIQEKDKAYYVQIKIPYNLYVPTAFIFKIRNTNNGVENINLLDFENDTHQVIKYMEAPYYITSNESSSVNVMGIGYTINNVQRYQAYTYYQLSSLMTTPFSEEDFNNIQENSSLQTEIQNYIKQNFNSSTATNFQFNIQKLDSSNINSAQEYIVFDFIFISKISWNQFICCYDRNSHDEHIMGGRTLNKNDTNSYLKIYPFIANSDLIERTEAEFGLNRIFHDSFGEISKLTLKVYNGTEALMNIPFYINSQSIKIGPSKQYTLDNTSIYNFGIPNINNYTCVIEYEYNDD